MCFCLITETWIRSNRDNKKILGDLLDGSHIELIRKDRGSRGGGVAIAYDTRKARFKRYQIQDNRYEIVCATGKLNNSSRKVALFSVYLPPEADCSCHQGN